MRRLAEGAAELAAEVRAREAGSAGEVVDVERLDVPGVGEIPGPQEVARSWNEGHRHQRPPRSPELIGQEPRT